MSPALSDRDADLQRLRDEGYTVEIDESAYVLVRDVVYVTPASAVATDGVLAYPYTENGPENHVAFFAGERPSKRDGTAFGFESNVTMAISNELNASFQLSAKDPNAPVDADYYVKFKRYLTILGAQAEAAQPGSTEPRYRPVADADPTSPFQYLDSASSRAGIVKYSRRLEQGKIAIVGLGGTGSYILDLVSKTRVGEVHLFDGDKMLSHNAFRAPGAASKAELDAGPKKVDYYANKYGVLKKNIIPHAYCLDRDNAHELSRMEFIFLAMEGGSVKRDLVEAMEQMGLSFIDASIDVLEMGDGLGGTVQVTTSTPNNRGHFARRVDFSDAQPDDIYSSNVQVADLNALNAVFAVLKWKKLRHFYGDTRNEYWSAYSVDMGVLANGEEANP